VLTCRRLLCGLLLALLAACGDGPSGPVAGVRLLNAGPSEAIWLPPGVPVRLQVEVYDSNFNLLPTPPRAAFTWESSNPAVATVSGDGVAQVQPGATPNDFATIRVGYEQSEGFVHLVAALPPVALHLEPGSATLTPGARLMIVGLAENSAGERETGHLFNFALSSGASLAHLAYMGCSSDRCMPRLPNVVTLQPDRTGMVTVTGTADGKTATATFLVRSVRFTGVTAGAAHTCGSTTDGAWFCWGYGYIESPLQVAVPAGIATLHAGSARTCGLDAGGLAYCWPDSAHPVPGLVSPSISFAQLSLAPTSACGVDTGGVAWCWGENVWGQLGNGSRDPSNIPVAVVGGISFQQVDTYASAAGFAHACGISTAGAAYCWGANLHGEVVSPAGGDPACEDVCWMAPVPVLPGRTFTQIVTGSEHSCAIETVGAVWCWGHGLRLGVPPPIPADERGPLPISGGQTFVSLTAGANHTCGLTATGAAYCWGENYYGQSGQPADSPSYVYTPTRVSNLSFTAISAGTIHTCGLAGVLYCWGDNRNGQVGVPPGSMTTQELTRVLGQP
jgi:alpha-tubulin suppressor-like RCC1 family protein